MPASLLLPMPLALTFVDHALSKIQETDSFKRAKLMLERVPADLQSHNQRKIETGDKEGEEEDPCRRGLSTTLRTGV